MLNIQKETSDQGLLLKLEGEATVESAELLQQALLEGFEQAEHLSVDCQETTVIDIYVLQLLCSAHRSSVTWKKHFSFAGTPAEEVVKAIENTGFMREQGCSLCPENITCMWSGHLN